MTPMLFEHWGSRPDERRRVMVGDELTTNPGVSATRAITVDGPPETVFPWIAQMGFRRAGWYSYDLIDNLGRRSARHINPDWAVTAAGDVMPAGPISFDVTHLQDPDHLVIALMKQGIAGHSLAFTLAFELTAERTDAPDGTIATVGTPPLTRLVSRVRIAIDGPLGRPLAWILGVGDGVMVRRQLLGIADRCRAATSSN